MDGMHSAGEVATGILIRHLIPNLGPDETTGTTTDGLVQAIIGLVSGSNMVGDDVDRLQRMDGIDLWDLCTGIHSSAAELLRWEGPLTMTEATIHLDVRGEGEAGTIDLPVDQLCDSRGTPALIVRQGCLHPDDAAFYAAVMGRNLADLRVDPHPAEVVPVEEWALGEDLLDALLSVICIRRIALRALCDSLGDTGGTDPQGIVRRAFGQKAVFDPCSGTWDSTGIDGRILLGSVERLFGNMR